MADAETPHVLEINCTTGEATTRPMTADELAVRDADQAAQAAAEATRLAAQQQRAADVTTILGAMPTAESKAALARFLGVPDAG
jgi:hypothetical protein